MVDCKTMYSRSPLLTKYTDLLGDETKYQDNIILMSVLVPCNYCCLPIGPSSCSSFV